MTDTALTILSGMGRAVVKELSNGRIVLRKPAKHGLL
jgi:hypothetical protein